jgi:hypothetical protein
MTFLHEARTRLLELPLTSRSHPRVYRRRLVSKWKFVALVLSNTSTKPPKNSSLLSKTSSTFDMVQPDIVLDESEHKPTLILVLVSSS